MNRGYPGHNRGPIRTYPNPDFLKKIFSMHDEQVREFEPHDDNFELELKKFYSFGRRRSGRSKMLARVLLEIAIESGQKVYLKEHYLGSDTRDILRFCQGEIERIAHEYKDRGLYLSLNFERDLSFTAYVDFQNPHQQAIYSKLMIENNPNMFRPVQSTGIEKDRINKKLLLLL